MTDITPEQLPKPVAVVAQLAADAGLRWRATFAEGAPATIALRVSGHSRRGWALWTVEDGRARWRSGASTVPLCALRTRGAFVGWLSGEQQVAA